MLNPLKYLEILIAGFAIFNIKNHDFLRITPAKMTSGVLLRNINTYLLSSRNEAQIPEYSKPDLAES